MKLSSDTMSNLYKLELSLSRDLLKDAKNGPKFDKYTRSRPSSGSGGDSNLRTGGNDDFARQFIKMLVKALKQHGKGDRSDRSNRSNSSNGPGSTDGGAKPRNSNGGSRSGSTQNQQQRTNEIKQLIEMLMQLIMMIMMMSLGGGFGNSDGANYL
jgi:hypothetical protein